MTKFKVLSTKKLNPSLVSEAALKNVAIIEAEFISVQPLISEYLLNRIRQLVRHNIALVFTSAHAVSIVDQCLHQGVDCNLPSWKIFSLSGKTGETIVKSQHMHESTLIHTAENAAELAKKIIDYGVQELVFFCGDKRRDELPNIVTSAGIGVEEIVVYRTIETPVIQTDQLDGVLFFSPSAVQSFFSVNQLNKKAVCFAIGETTAAAIAGYTNNTIITSEFPRQELLIATAENYFQHR